MGECCSTSKLEESNQVELFEAFPVSSGGAQHSREPSSMKRGGIWARADVQTELGEIRSEDAASLEGSCQPTSMFNSRVNSPILTNRSSFNNTLGPGLRDSLTNRPILISDEVQVPDSASAVEKLIHRVNQSFVDIAADPSTVNSSKIESVVAFSPAETLDGRRGRVEVITEESAQTGKADRVMKAFMDGGRSSVYVEGTRVGSQLERARAVSERVFGLGAHFSVNSEQMAMDVFS